MARKKKEEPAPNTGTLNAEGDYEVQITPELLSMLDPDIKASIVRRNIAEAKKFESEADLHNAGLREQLVVARAAERAEAEALTSDKFDNTYRFEDAVGPASVQSCIKSLNTMHRLNPTCDITIVFSSPGGDIINGMKLFDYIRYIRGLGHKVTTINLGMAASMAGILLQAGDVRLMGREAYLLIHEASFMALGKFGEVEDTIKLIKKMQARILGILSERSNLTPGQITKRWKRTDWWLDSEETLKLGLVDGIL